MNSFGLNSAALNAGVANYVLGAALLVAAGSINATPTRTTYADQIAVATTAQITANPLRTANGIAVPVQTVFSPYADGVIAITASAAGEASSGLSARYTDAYAPAAWSGSATGQIIRPGTGSTSFSLSASVLAVRIAMLEATSVASAGGSYADASVRRSGQGTTERDGYVKPFGTVAGFTAGGVRTALAVASIEGAGDLVAADSIKSHGGRATVSAKMTVSALPASDVAYSPLIATFTARARHTHAARASIAVKLGTSAIPQLGTQGRAQPVETVSDFIADGRLAHRSTADLGARLSIVANCRLAEQGRGTSYASFGTDAAPWIYRAASASTDLAGAFSAIGTRTCFGAATAESEIGLTAIGIANPATPAPSSRTMRIQASSRLMSIPYQNRTMRAT